MSQDEELGPQIIMKQLRFMKLLILALHTYLGLINNCSTHHKLSGKLAGGKQAKLRVKVREVLRRVLF
jgi:hypothetical protein